MDCIACILRFLRERRTCILMNRILCGRCFIADIGFNPLYPDRGSGISVRDKGVDLTQRPEFGSRVLLADKHTMRFL